MTNENYNKQCKKQDYYIASVSGGKDSLAMVYRLITENKPLNEIVFYDTGMEFTSIYVNLVNLKNYAEALKIKCTRLFPECPFLYKMLEKPVNVGKPNEHKGYSWCGGVCRWGTTEKLKTLDKYAEVRGAFVYVGIAADETKRIVKKRKPYKLFPLVDWNMTEKDCLIYCRSLGINWIEPVNTPPIVDLYAILDRVSCWCCGNKNLYELYNIWRYLPKYWQKLKDLQSKTERPFKKSYSIFDLEAKFKSGYVPKHKPKIT